MGQVSIALQDQSTLRFASQVITALALIHKSRQVKFFLNLFGLRVFPPPPSETYRVFRGVFALYWHLNRAPIKNLFNGL